MVEVKRKKAESFESLIRRYNKRLVQSGKVLQAKKVRYEIKKPNQNLRRKLALRRIKVRGQKDYLRKIGKLKEENNRK